jgi:predicted glutamine amidotransferase
VKFDFNVLADSYKGNPDGTGVMYFNGETMVIQKFEPTESIETIYAYVQSIENIAEAKNIAIHFRISTSGRGTDMTHPHHVNGNMWIMHNGIMTYGEWKEFQEQWYNRNSNISDTRFTAM